MFKQFKRNFESFEDKKSIEGILKFLIIKEGIFGNFLLILIWINKNFEWDFVYQILLINFFLLNLVQGVVVVKELFEDDYVMFKIDDLDRIDKGIFKKKSQEKKRVKFFFEN